MLFVYPPPALAAPAGPGVGVPGLPRRRPAPHRRGRPPHGRRRGPRAGGQPADAPVAVGRPDGGGRGGPGPGRRGGGRGRPAARPGRPRRVGQATVIAFASRATVVTDPATLGRPGGRGRPPPAVGRPALGRRRDGRRRQPRRRAPTGRRAGAPGRPRVGAALRRRRVRPRGRRRRGVPARGTGDRRPRGAAGAGRARTGRPPSSGRCRCRPPPGSARRSTRPCSWTRQPPGRSPSGWPPGGSPVSLTTTVTPGRNDVHVSLPLLKAGLTPVRATVRPLGDDGPAAAGPVLAAVDVRPAPRVLLVQDAPEAGLLQALGAVLGPAARVTPVTPDQLAAGRRTTSGPSSWPTCRPTACRPRPRPALRRAVLDGTGLVLAGAARSFGPGGYDDSQLAPLLPVRMPQQAESIDPSTTLVLIFDTSGSMRGERIDLAKEVARMAVSHLRPQDKVGVVEFYGGRRWAAPIQSAANLSVIHRTLDRLTAGGGTVLYPAVEEAAFALRNVHTRTKNVFVISDGGRGGRPVRHARAADGRGRRGRDDRQGRHRRQPQPDGRHRPLGPGPVLRGGRPVRPAGRDAQAAAAVAPVPGRPHGVRPCRRRRPARGRSVADDADARRLGARPRVRPHPVAKPTADVLLRTAGGDPLLARWRYGAGLRRRPPHPARLRP